MVRKIKTKLRNLIMMKSQAVAYAKKKPVKKVAAKKPVNKKK
jgi:hypothetical protein